MNINSLLVVAYDISSDRLRQRVAGRLEDLGVRVQKSVFELRGPRARLLRQVADIATLLERGDSIRVYPLSPRAIEESLTFGAAVRPETYDFFLL